MANCNLLLQKISGRPKRDGFPGQRVILDAGG